MSVKKCIAAVAVSMCLVAPPVAAQIFSWDPLKDVQEVLPGGVPSEAKIIQARQQVREMSQDALASLYEVAPGTRRAIERSAGYAVFSTFGVKLFFSHCIGTYCIYMSAFFDPLSFYDRFAGRGCCHQNIAIAYILYFFFVADLAGCNVCRFPYELFTAFFFP